MWRSSRNKQAVECSRGAEVLSLREKVREDTRLPRLPYSGHRHPRDEAARRHTTRGRAWLAALSLAEGGQRPPPLSCSGAGVSSSAAITPDPLAAAGGAALTVRRSPGHPGVSPHARLLGPRKEEAPGGSWERAAREREGTVLGPPRGAPEQAAPVSRSSPAQHRPPRRYLEARPNPAPPARGPHPSAGQTRPPGAAA